MKQTKDELRWQAESDASTMARYQEILSDKPRMNRAIKEAQRQASDLTKRANVMKSVSGIKSGRATGKKK